ncbi:lysylphosphatidylglycerol synthase domain-containing protein [Candidatus Solirubrobacter pratensis]|uniref:lysylphosphatidylglycerol synthase domain-containing protein n=1 Tax=Candidatus Solirubrobacter pratensis TaxID=1298857 RepID=UPI0004825C40|nr:lysylphosphatidylglycerol synthase domain-containing protein [Candidatus Solirubrobacter pratensis]
MARTFTLTGRRVGYALATTAALAATVVACRRLDLSALAAATPGWVLAALALNSAAMLMRALAWTGMLHAALPAERIGAGRVVRATMIGVLGSAVAPGRVGEPLRAWVIARGLARRERLATVVGTLVTQTILNLVALVMLALVALPGGFAIGGRTATLLAVGWPAAAVVAVLAGARLAPRGFVARQLASVRKGLSVFRPLRRGVAITTLQLTAWGLQALAAYALLRALDVHVPAPLATAAAILVAVNVTAAVPLTPSNIGIFQAACIGVLAVAGVGSGLGLSYGLLLQAAELATAIVLGLPAVAAELGLRRAGC